LDLAEYIGPGLRLRRAALLLFAKEPSRWHPRLQIRILKVEGTELKTGAQYNAKSDQTVNGNVLELIEKGWDGLRPQLVQTRLGVAARFESTVMYPELACREALVNAIAHRDYSEEGRGIEIYVFADRMEVRNPGGLLSSLSIEELLRLDGAHQSRNAMLCRVLRELGYMRELGEGMRRIFELMRTSELTAPEISSTGNSFQVTLHHSTIYSADQLLWLSQFDGMGLNREQKAIVALGIRGRLVSPQDIWDTLGIVDTEHYRQLVMSLQELGILTSQITKTKAQNLARRQRTTVRRVPRFSIGVPRQSEPIRDHGGDPEATEDAPDPNACLWLGNLDSAQTEASLLGFLSKFGEVMSLRMPLMRGKSRGYAFVDFQSPEVATEMREKLDGQSLGNRRIVARIANRRSRDE
jgi:ATP-dependent DNA helicase RecG